MFENRTSISFEPPSIRNYFASSDRLRRNNSTNFVTSHFYCTKNSKLNISFLELHLSCHFRQIQSETWAILRRQRNVVYPTYTKAIGSILIKSEQSPNLSSPLLLWRTVHHSRLTLFIENLKARFHLFLLTTNQSVLRGERVEHRKK